ncbi:MAG: hypothetical protein ACW981_12400 [Candidatus Hodarchaeales archaeon]|jgi:Fe-S-cluster containining protein
MTYLITEKELLELRQILDSHEGENECVTCGLCCKISGKFFLDLEQNRISKKYSFNLFSKDHGISTIQTTDFVPWCVGGNNQKINQNLITNERHIVKPNIQVDEIIFQTWFEEIHCQVYQERPILCRYYPYNTFPYYCMIGIEFSGEDSKQGNRFMNLMSKYIYTYRRECLQTIDFSFDAWKIKSSDQISITGNDNGINYIVKHQKGLADQNSIWNLWGYLNELVISNEEKMLMEKFDGTVTVADIIKNYENSLNYSSWQELLLNYLIFELVDYPEELLKVLLLGIVRF